MRSLLPFLVLACCTGLSRAASAQGDRPATSEPTTATQTLEGLAARVDAAHRPDGPVDPVTGFRAALEVHITAPDAEQTGQVDLDVRYLQYEPEGARRVRHLMRYRVERAGKPVERGADQYGFWHLVQGKARDITEADTEDRAACTRDRNLARQLVRFLDPGAVLRSLQQPGPVTTETLRFGREQGVECQTVEGTLESFPLLRLAGDDMPVRARIYVEKASGRLLAVLARPVVDGNADEAAAEMVRLSEPILDHGILVPKVIEHWFRDEEMRLRTQSKVLITSLDLRPEFALQDLERPK